MGEMGKMANLVPLSAIIPSNNFGERVIDHFFLLCDSSYPSKETK